MKKPLFYGSIVAVIIIMILIVMRFFIPSNSNLSITVPSPTGASGESNSSNGIKYLDVTPQTVQTALKTLTRADSFSRTYTIKSKWDGGESDSTLKMWKKTDNTRMIITQSGTVENILVRGNDLFVWYDGSSRVFTSKLSKSNVDSDVDKFSRLITYEDIYNVKTDDITKADYETKNSQPCIFAEYKSSDGNYVNQIYVALDSGLLLSSNVYQGATLVYSMTSETSLTTPPDDVFAVPST